MIPVTVLSLAQLTTGLAGCETGFFLQPPALTFLRGDAGCEHGRGGQQAAHGADLGHFNVSGFVEACRLIAGYHNPSAMIPLSDSIPSRTTPLVSYVMIGICSLAFLVQLSSKDGGQRIIEQYGMVPVRIADPDARPVIRQRVRYQTAQGIQESVIEHELAPAGVSPWLTMITCMFLHAGWMHFLGNMWFLYVFGDNVEDRLGHLGFAMLYIGTGIAAGIAHYVTDTMSAVPTIGASGAIAGVMGAYAWLYPDARVKAVLPLFVIIQVFVLPAPVFLGIWFAIQTFSGVVASTGGQAAGVAWWAHIGGFVAGMIVAVLVGRAHLDHGAVVDRRF
jgi:hypothetical protein